MKIVSNASLLSLFLQYLLQPMTIGSSHIYVDSYDFMKSRSIFIFLRRTLAVATLMAFFESSMLSQTVVVTDDATYTTGHVSSVLDVKSITKGFLIPRVTQVQRLSISSPANGLLVFQTDVTPGFYSYASGVWSLVGSSTADGSETKINAGTSIAVSGTGTTGNPYFISAQTQSVTQAQRASLTGLYAGRIIYCSDCGYLGKLQVYNGTAWTDLSGTTAILTTDATSDVKSTTATCGGNISSDGGYSITARGVCWSTTPNPTIYNDKTTNGSGTGSFSSSLTGLSPSTSYYVRAYATNSSGTSYGSNVSFTTTAYTVGDPCQGGIIAYITSDRILIAASSDQGSSIVWASSGSTTGATAQAIGTGDANTSTIYSSLGTGSSYAARVCKDLVLNGYSDWFLPSKDELYWLHYNRTAIGGFASSNYWSSSESTPANAWIQAFPGGTQTAVSKTGAASVRAIRELITVGYYYGGGRVASQNCFEFFEERISKDGQQITGTEFYFLENQGGRSFYTGKVVFRNKSGISNGVFIELFSDVNVFQPGYSELLLEKNYHGFANLKEYSFAKYINGRAVLRTGTFPYDDTDAAYLVADTEFRFFRSEKVDHLVYRNGNATVLISNPVISFSEGVISFAYLFVYIFLFFNLLVLSVHPPSLRGIAALNLRKKMQIAFIGVLLFSFVIVGVVVASFTIEQYKTKLYDNLKEKVSSIYLELEGRIASEKRLTPDWRNINYETLSDILINFSNIFLTDINIFDPNGFLLATSRPEIFSRDLVSRRMNNMAMMSLRELTLIEYFQRERIGRLEYMSAYVPFYNNDNEVLAYLNLPYFRMQSVLAREISNLIVAVINFTLLMIVVTMSIAVFISGRLTAPLAMLGKALASVEVGKKSEHLSYGGSDEIAELVRQYNRMVDEIDESTRRLADSEREYAWREMARQIAHEIKNPLTPMRLNVQQLLKSWNDKAPGFDRQIEKFAGNQIEYIDNLSNIASAFSSFARMPETAAVEVNLLDQIKTAVDLYRSTENVTFDVLWPPEKRVMIYADREQLNGIFSNLFKNAIQAVPENRKGIIITSVSVTGSKVVVMISDNGSGIPEELRKKMFTPNFTTKSSGTGLGLSIVKKYVESVNGRIWYESEPGKGTSFFLEFPLLYTVENHL